MARRFFQIVGLVAMLILSGCTGPIQIPDPCTLKHTFSSGGTHDLEEFTLTFPQHCFRAGDNVVVLKNANSPGGYWLIWDSLSLKDATGNTIWQLGKNDGIPFDPSLPNNHDFFVETMPDSQFPKDINDGTIPQISIHFKLTTAQTQTDLILFLDTLLAKHDPVAGFDMRITVNPQ
jgi:hypothetical protein